MKVDFFPSDVCVSFPPSVPSDRDRVLKVLEYFAAAGSKGFDNLNVDIPDKGICECPGRSKRGGRQRQLDYDRRHGKGADDAGESEEGSGGDSNDGSKDGPGRSGDDPGDGSGGDGDDPGQQYGLGVSADDEDDNFSVLTPDTLPCWEHGLRVDECAVRWNPGSWQEAMSLSMGRPAGRTGRQGQSIRGGAGSDTTASSKIHEHGGSEHDDGLETDDYFSWHSCADIDATLDTDDLREAEVSDTSPKAEGLAVRFALGSLHSSHCKRPISPNLCDRDLSSWSSWPSRRSAQLSWADLTDEEMPGMECGNLQTF